MKKVIIASTNPVKIQATKNAFGKIFPDEQFEFQGVQIASGVSDQPMSDQETLQGALNRVQNAKKEISGANFWVGLEGGLQVTDIGMEAWAWMIVLDESGKLGRSRSASFILPPKVADLVKQGYELATADDMVFNRENSKHKDGAAGILTHGVVTRTDFYEEAMIFALIPFANPGLY